MSEEIPDYEFKNLTRSTLPLLAWWKNKAAALALIGEKCGFDDLTDASVSFEFPTLSAGPHDKASYTDVMVESLSTAIAIEGKWTEPRYETVAKWSEQGNMANRKKVLSHWVDLIRNRAGDLQPSAVEMISYQMIHRTASACARSGKLPVVLYQVFRDQKHVSDYTNDLQQLAKALGQTNVQLWLAEIPLRLTEQYRRMESEIAASAPEQRSALIREALHKTELFSFGDPAFIRVA